MHNKKIGNRASEVLLLNFCAKLNGGNSIQHFVLKVDSTANASNFVNITTPNSNGHYRF